MCAHRIGAIEVHTTAVSELDTVQNLQSLLQNREHVLLATKFVGSGHQAILAELRRRGYAELDRIRGDETFVVALPNRPHCMYTTVGAESFLEHVFGL